MGMWVSSCGNLEALVAFNFGGYGFGDSMVAFNYGGCGLCLNRCCWLGFGGVGERK